MLISSLEFNMNEQNCVNSMDILCSSKTAAEYYYLIGMVDGRFINAVKRHYLN